MLNWVDNDHIYGTHRRGWRVVRDLFVDKFHDLLGIACFSWADRVLKTDRVISYKWCGFLHNVISYPEEYPSKYRDKIYSLEALVKENWFKQSLERCEGIWTLTRHTAAFLQQHISVPVEAVWHPCVQENGCWKGNSKTVVSLGQWMRRHHSNPNLRLPRSFRKVIVKVAGHDLDYEEMKQYCRSDASWEYWDRLNNLQYDEILSRSIVFLDLYDVAACNVIMECIMMNTPLVVRRLPAAEEYLGRAYPLFFDSLEEAEHKIQDDIMISRANNYLSLMDKSHLAPAAFADVISSSPIYRNASFRILL